MKKFLGKDFLLETPAAGMPIIAANALKTPSSRWRG